MFTIEMVDLTDDTQVNSGGGTDTQSLQPDAGYVYEVVDIYAYIPDPVGSTANSHKLAISMQNCTTAENIATIISATGNYIAISCSGFVGSTSEQPSNHREQFLIKQGGLLFASNSQPLDFKYTNSTDANQTGTRRIEVWVKKYREAQ
jgi:hypothetical protein